MVILKMKDIRNMNIDDKIKKIEELKYNLLRSTVGVNKTKVKKKEIKKAIARLITSIKSLNAEVNKK